MTLYNRRNFIKSASTAGIGAGLISQFSPILSIAGSPNDKIVIAVAGTNSRGLYMAQTFAKLKNIEIAYICDPDQLVIDKSVAEMEKLTGKKPKGIKDFRKALDDKSIDAMLIATPDHWHAPMSIMSVVAGKHVYVEKPCSHNPREGEMLVEATRKYKKLVQMGNQRRSFPNVNQAIRELKEGIIGRVYFAKGWYSNNRSTIGIGKTVAVPANLDFDLWQGPAPRREYKDNLVPYNWHWNWHYGTGEALNNGTHEIDVMRWGLGVEYPTKVVSAGGRFRFKDDWETPDTQTISFEFPNNTAMSWEGRSCNGHKYEGSGRGVIFYGEKGTLIIPGGDAYTILDTEDKILKEVKETVTLDPTNIVSATAGLDGIHAQNFADSIRGIAKLTSEIEEGHKSTLLCQLGNISYRTGRALHCDTSTGHIKNDPEAMKLWSRTYEKGWEPKY